MHHQTHKFIFWKDKMKGFDVDLIFSYQIWMMNDVE